MMELFKRAKGLEWGIPHSRSSYLTELRETPLSVR